MRPNADTNSGVLDNVDQLHVVIDRLHGANESTTRTPNGECQDWGAIISEQLGDTLPGKRAKCGCGLSHLTPALSVGH